MIRVAIIFASYGHPNQPFLVEWFSRVCSSQTISVRGFTDHNHPRAGNSLIELKPKGIRRIFRLAISRLLNEKRYPYYLRPVVSFNPHVIHILNAQQFGAYESILSFLKAKVVVSFRGFETTVRPLNESIWLGKLQEIYQRVDSLHFVSDYLKAIAVGYGAPSRKCVVIRRTVDTQFFQPVERKNNSLVKVLSVGRLTWQKGFPVLLQAFALLNRRQLNCKLTLVGEGEDRELLEKQVDEEGIYTDVTFAGHLGRSALRNEYYDADIFVQPSISDALPNSLLEAQACGLPIVATRVGGIPEAVREGKTALLVEPSNPSQLANALETLIANSALRLKMSRCSRRFIEEEFSNISEQPRWSEYYRKI